jgi:AcrR family transcriptional regulator
MAVKSAGRQPSSNGGGERVAQKRRTRKAIVNATIALLAAGKTPTVTDVAAAADVSRRTVFLYFPTFDQLLIDATVGALTESSVDHAFDHAAVDEDPGARVERLVRAMHHFTPATERLGRSLVRLTVDAAAGDRDLPRRGFRRMEWIESALAPWRSRITRAEWRRLVCGLAMVVGWEALITQRDVCGLSAAEGEELSAWAARALVGEALGKTWRRRAARPPKRTKQD